jgi:hypothetical protein
MKYVWKNSYGHEVPAEDAADELERIRLENEGKLIPVNVVEASEPKEAVLHPCFEWRNSVAANRYREYQARNLIRGIRIIKDDDQQIPQFANVRITNEQTGKNESFYQNTTVLIKRPDELMSAISLLQTKLSAIENSIQEIVHLAKEHQDEDRVSRLVIAARAIETARAALQ